jgi:radical SAM protein with 4Fe4S-binding SPASM domain
MPARPPDDPARFGLLRDLPSLVAVHADAQRRSELTKQPDLSYLFWECTLKCNLRCLHCGSSCEPTSPVRELSTEEMMGILDTIREDFDTTRMTVAITGGEPLLRHDLYEVMARMTSFGMCVGIVSNGTLLTEERSKRLLASGLQTMSVSIDGFDEIHDKVRGEGTFAKTMRGVQTARRSGIEYIEIITCVRPANVGRLAEVERAVRETGANNWRLITIDRMGRVAGEADPEMWLTPPMVRELFDFIETRRRELTAAGDPFDMRFSCGGFLGVRREGAVRPGDAQCFAGLGIASILSDGKVSACPSLPRSWAQGSALEQRFSTIWHSRFEKFRDVSARKTGKCADCEWWHVCLGGGLHEWLAQPDDFCWLERQRGD